jgi:hypothetical protein
MDDGIEITKTAAHTCNIKCIMQAKKIILEKSCSTFFISRSQCKSESQKQTLYMNFTAHKESLQATTQQLGDKTGHPSARQMHWHPCPEANNNFSTAKCAI